MCRRELGRVQKWIDPGSNEKMPFGKHLGMFSSMVWTGLHMAQKLIDPGSDQKMSFEEHLGVFSFMVWTGLQMVQKLLRTISYAAGQVRPGLAPRFGRHLIST